MEGERELAAGVSARLTAGEGRRFGLVVGGAFLVLALVLWRRGHPAGMASALVLAAGLIGAGLVLPTRLGPVYRAWMGLAHAISKVTTPVIMGLIFFLVFTPAGFLVRLFGHRPLARQRGVTTYWKARPDGATRGSMDHQF